MRFSIKALGDYTTRLQRGLKVGDPVQVEGPYGCFDFLGAAEGRQLWIAGGIGIAPFMAWLEALKQMPEECPDIKLLYCVRDASIAPYAARLQELCAGLPRIDLQLHSSDDEGWLRIDDLGLRWEEPWPSVWICGPTRLAMHLTRELLRLGLPRKCLHQELFQMR